MSTKSLTPFAIDPGASKLLAYAPGAERVSPALFRTVFQSAHIAPVTDAFAGDDGLADEHARPLTIESAHVPPIYCGDHAARWGTPVDALDFERFTGTPEMRGLLYAMLTAWYRQHGPFNAPLHIGLALPNAAIANASPEHKDQIKTWLMGDHRWVADGSESHGVIIGDVSITSQGVAALFDWSLTDDGKIITDRVAALKREIGIISIGHRTVELTVVENRERIPRFTAGRDLGAAQLLRLLDPKAHYSLAELEPRLRAGTLDAAALANALPLWERKIVGFVDDVWGRSWARFAAVVVVGGGAVLLPNFAARFGGKASVPDQPTHAVARGLLKSMLAKIKRA